MICSVRKYNFHQNRWIPEAKIKYGISEEPEPGRAATGRSTKTKPRIVVVCLRLSGPSVLLLLPTRKFRIKMQE